MENKEVIVRRKRILITSGKQLMELIAKDDVSAKWFYKLMNGSNHEFNIEDYIRGTLSHVLSDIKQRLICYEYIQNQ